MKTSTIEQTRVITSTAADLLAIAGPGSGKTYTLIERIKHLVKGGALPSRMVAITFTNAAADEMKARLEDIRLGYVGTLHGFMLLAMRRYGESIGFTEKVAVLDEAATKDLLQRVSVTLNYRGPLREIEAALNKWPDISPSTATPAQLVACEFYRTLRRNNLVTFDSLLVYGMQLASSMRTYTHLFVDEFQDSGNKDMSIYEALPIPHKFRVGDPDQSIYAFRGGNLMNILDVASRGDVQVVALESNYRCDAPIADAAQELIQHNVCRVNKRTISATGLDGAVTFQHHGSAMEERAHIATVISRGNPDAFAVLLRTNFQVKEWADYLSGMGIPVAIKKLAEVPQDWRKARLVLSCLNDPTNDMLALWLAEMEMGSDKARRLKLEAASQGMPLNELTFKFPYNLSQEALWPILGRLVSKEACLRISDCSKGMDAPTIGDLLLRLAELDNASPLEMHGVTVTTMHGAKGREWDVVFLPELEQESMPGKCDDEELAEERRLMYVAMTRARHGLHLSAARQRMPRFGRKELQPMTPSQFITEAGLNCKLVAVA